jgi:hypothetical protein
MAWCLDKHSDFTFTFYFYLNMVTLFLTFRYQVTLCYEKPKLNVSKYQYILPFHHFYA